MDTTNDSSSRMDWILFLVSFVIFVFMLLYVDEWFWVALPFVLTYFAKALKVM